MVFLGTLKSRYINQNKYLIYIYTICSIKYASAKKDLLEFLFLLLFVCSFCFLVAHMIYVRAIRPQLAQWKVPPVKFNWARVRVRPMNSLRAQRDILCIKACPSLTLHTTLPAPWRCRSSLTSSSSSFSLKSKDAKTSRPGSSEG